MPAAHEHLQHPRANKCGVGLLRKNRCIPAGPAFANFRDPASAGRLSIHLPEINSPPLQYHGVIAESGEHIQE
ncbi:unnamed protein product, partial [Iphiclides podalirius]